LRELFQFGVLHIDDLALVAGAALLVLFALELLKLFWHARLRT